ncbi:MAG: hypothetical protein KKH01_01710 [Firmicutes bacterium]|nr:hypothetical protein [Bacillota bacterium]
MNKKLVIIFVIVLFVIQAVTLLILNIKYNSYNSSIFDDYLLYYFRTIIFYAVLNDALIFTVGILVYYKNQILKSRIISICAGLLSLSMLLVVVSGLYYAFTLDISLENTNYIENINSFLNIFYVVYMLSFTLFVVMSLKVQIFSERLPKILLLILFAMMILVYLRQSTYYGFIHQWTNYDVSIDTSIRQGISNILLYPASIAAFIISTLILVKNHDKHIGIE